MKFLCILPLLFATACNISASDSPGSDAVRTPFTQADQAAALALLLEEETTTHDSRLNGEIACKIGHIYRNQGRPDLARRYFLHAFSKGFLDLGGFAAETSVRTAPPLLVPLSEIEYDFRRKRFSEEQAHLQKVLHITTGSGIALLLLIVLGYIRLRYRRKQETVTLLALIDNLNHSTTSLLSELDDRKSSEVRLKKLLANRFSEVRELTDTVYQYEHNPVLLHRKLRETLSLRTTDSTLFDDLEEVVDAYRNGLIRRLKEQYSALTPNELKFCALLAAGFSAQEICILLNIQTVQNVWMKKYRLRCKLGLPPGTDVDIFLHDFAQVESQESENKNNTIENQQHDTDTQS